MTQGQNLYSQAGVDVKKGDQLVDWIQGNQGDQTQRVVSGVGGFAALFRPDFRGMTDPLLVASTDGVGTKVLLATQTGFLDGLGQDLVAMCVNDLYCTGASPLFFLDYYATSTLDEGQFKAVISGIQRACSVVKIPLLGGETAEMPGLYAPKEFDLAGFVVGLVDGPRRLDPSMVQDGDCVYAIPSSGFHSNGFSLLRKWVKDFNLSAQDIDYLLTPTMLYAMIPDLIKELPPSTIHGLAHITGGGLSGNIPRVLPRGAVAEIHKKLIRVPAQMESLFARCGVSAIEVENIFNLGIGMVAVIESNKEGIFQELCQNKSIDTYRIGEIRLRHQQKSHELEEAEVLYV
jgi:phosphoribosylformylglycinamidine cyclo-ligase